MILPGYWLAGWHAQWHLLLRCVMILPGWLACSMASITQVRYDTAWLVGWLAGWHAQWHLLLRCVMILPGWLAGWLAGMLNGIYYSGAL